MSLLACVAIGCESPAPAEASPNAAACPIPVSIDEGEVPADVRSYLQDLARSYNRWFGVHPSGLRVELVTRPEDAPTFDHFDQVRNTIRMSWYDETELFRWTLAHELAHAYQWALDPIAYEEEPSWIHEGLAEYLVSVELRDRNPAAADAFLAEAAANDLDHGLAFERVFADVYQAPWQRTYPPAHLAVEVLAREENGHAKLLAYFRSHGGPHPARALSAIFGFGPRELARRGKALALALEVAAPPARH